jgi:predicted site-specific integrase-resolvase
MTIKEAVQFTGKSEKTIRNYIKEGKLVSRKIDGKYDIEEYELKRVFGRGNSTGNLPEIITILEKQLEEKEHQLQEKDNQIAELHRLLAVAQANVNRITEQNQLLLEDMRKPQPLWQRLKARLGLGTVG